MSAHRPTIQATRHAVAASHYLAAEAGYAVLEAGGNAIDAGVAAGLTLGVVHSDIVNIAGVAPIMIRLATGEIVSLDGLGVWPRATDIGMFQREHGGVIPEGILRTVVPAAPSAWLTALARYGTMSLGEVAGMAIDCAAHGFPVYPLFANTIAENRERYARWPDNARIYLPDGRPPAVGEIFLQTDLADTLRYLVDEERARGGSRRDGLEAAHRAFYQGDVAVAIADYHRQHGGWLEREDLAAFRVREEPTVAVAFGDLTVHCCGPWCQGPSLAQLLTLLAPLDLAGFGHNSDGYLHLLVEAVKRVFADRERYIGDPAFNEVPLERLLGEDYLGELRRAIDPQRAWSPTDEAAGGTASGDLDTAYVAVVDHMGNCFSATPSDTSADTPVIPGTGLCPSSRGSQSRADPTHPAAAGPGRRPRLTPNPALVLKGNAPWLVFGTPGGDVQVQAMAQVLLNLAVFGMDVQEAVEAPRVASFDYPGSFAPHTRHPGLVRLENRLPADLDAELGRRGHRVERWPDWSWKAGGVCAIRVGGPGACHRAGADPRRESYALGR